MSKLNRKQRWCAVIVIACAMMMGGTLSAAPYVGNEFALSQPDGNSVPVLVFGDEFYQHIESLDGYTLVRDDDGWICYAELNADGTELVSTGVRYIGEADARFPAGGYFDAAAVQSKHIRLPADVVREKVRRQKAFLNEDIPFGAGSAAPQGAAANAAAAASRVGELRGLTLLIDFSDEPAAVPRQEVDDYCNLQGYSGNGNNGSIRDYFYDVSNGQLEYTNFVTAYYRAVNPKTYYDDADYGYVQRAQELINEALDNLEASGFDFSTLSVDEYGYVIAFNVLYAGVPTQGWSKGLWPHSSGISTRSFDGDVSISRYQMTNTGAALTIGTFIHENGHLICGWPDLYDYGYESYGIGYYGIMGYGNHAEGGKNPIPPNGYFRQSCGWETPIDITASAPGTLLSHTTNTYMAFKYAHPTLNNEFFVIESRKKEGRNTGLPDEGLLIWHVDTNGSNNNEAMLPTSHYLVSVEQADGLFDLENYTNSGSDGDLFDGITSTKFHDFTTPDSRWWSGDRSWLSIRDISPVSPSATTVSFVIGEPITDESVDLTIDLDSDDGLNDNSVRLSIRVTNNEDTGLDLSKYALAYYLYEPALNLGNAVWDTYYCNLTSAVAAELSPLDSPAETGEFKADIKLAFTFPAGTVLPAKQQLEISGALHTVDWQYNFNEQDDWSHAVEGETTFITLIDKASGIPVFGDAPEGNTVSEAHLAASPESLYFPRTDIGTASNLTLTFSNDGSAPTEITGLAIDNPDFTVNATLPLTVPAEGSAMVTVTFSPAGPDTAAGTLTVESNAVNNPTINIPLSGSGAYVYDLQVLPDPFITGAQILFDIQDSALDGTTAYFTLVRILEDDSVEAVEEFDAVVSLGTNTISRPTWDALASGLYQLKMRFAGWLVIADDCEFEKLEVDYDYNLSIIPNPVVTDGVVTFQVSNPAVVGDTAALTLKQDGVVISNTEVVLDLGDNTVVYTFSSYYTDGTYTLDLVIGDQIVDSISFEKEPKDYTLTLSTAAVDFGQVKVGESKNAVLTVTNVGNYQAVISGLYTLPEAAFSVNESLPIIVMPGDSHDITVVYAPQAEGAVTGSLTILNAPDTTVQTLEVSLAGEGTLETDGVVAEVVIQNHWDVGYCANIVVSNNGAQSISTWEVVMNTNESTVINSWNGNFSDNAGEVTVTPLSWNGQLSPGSSTAVGFCADKIGPLWEPEIVIAQ